MASVGKIGTTEQLVQRNTVAPMLVVLVAVLLAVVVFMVVVVVVVLVMDVVFVVFVVLAWRWCGTGRERVAAGSSAAAAALWHCCGAMVTVTVMCTVVGHDGAHGMTCSGRWDAQCDGYEEDDTLEVALTTMITSRVLCSLFCYEKDNCDNVCRSCHLCRWKLEGRARRRSQKKKLAERFDAVSDTWLAWACGVCKRAMGVEVFECYMTLS